MMNNKEMIEKLKMNIAVSNFKTELNENEESKEYALKNEKFWRLYEMKKKIAIMITCIILMMYGVVFAFEMFSDLNGDELSLGAKYEGDGIISIYVENKSNKTLDFEKNIKLMKWSNSEEIKPISDKIKMENTKFNAKSSGVMKLDISKMYDLGEIEKPLISDDHYYLILTNNNFIFGNDWHCSIEFNKSNNEGKTSTEIVYKDKIELDSSLVSKNVNEELEKFFKEWVINPSQRNEKVAEYYQKVYELLEKERTNGKNIISPVNPWLFVGKPSEDVIFDDRVPKELQYKLIGEHHYALDVFNIPIGSSDIDTCMILNTAIPRKSSEINTVDGEPIPLIYIFQFDVKELQKSNSYVFIRGKLYNYNDLDKYKVHQDDKYVSYNVTELFYKDLEMYIDTYTKDRNDIYIDEGIKTRIKNIYDYYMNKENLEKAFYYHE